MSDMNTKAHHHKSLAFLSTIAETLAKEIPADVLSNVRNHIEEFKKAKLQELLNTHYDLCDVVTIRTTKENKEVFVVCGSETVMSVIRIAWNPNDMTWIEQYISKNQPSRKAYEVLNNIANKD